MGVCFVYPRVIKHGHGHGQISHLFDDFPIQIARLFCYVGFSTGCMPHQTWGLNQNGPTWWFSGAFLGIKRLI